MNIAIPIPSSELFFTVNSGSGTFTLRMPSCALSLTDLPFCPLPVILLFLFSFTVCDETKHGFITGKFSRQKGKTKNKKTVSICGGRGHVHS